MANKTLRIYATSNSTDGEGQRPYQNLFWLESGLPPVTIYFDIPSNITKYTVSKFGYYAMDKSGMYTDTMKLTIVNSATSATQIQSLLEIGDKQITINSNQQTSRTQTVTMSNNLVYPNHSATIAGAKAITETQKPYLDIIYNEVDVANLTIAGTDLDIDILASWEGSCESWTLQAILNGTVVKSWDGTTATNQIISKGSVSNIGTYTFKLIGYGGDSKEITTTATLTKTLPTISSIEPNNVNQNVDNDINISWVSENQQSYKIEIDGITYTGTTQKALTIPGGTLIQGTKTIKLTTFYTSSWGEVRSATLSVSFIGYGKPPLPVLNIKSLYSTATPSVKWTSSGQVAYRIIITSGISTIIDTQEVISPNLYYTLSTALSNNTDYVVKLKVKNQYNLWSDEVTGNFRTEFNVPVTPLITVIADSTGAIIVNVSANVTSDTTYKNTEIWRKEELGEWVRIAYNLNANVAYRDFYVASEKVYEYKARNIATSGGISESDVVSTSTKVKGYTFYDVENRNNYVAFKNDVTVNPKFNTNEASNIFAGNEKPTTEQGQEGYYDCTISFKTTDRSLEAQLIKLKRTSKVLLFKDRRGHKYFGNIVGSIGFNEDSLGIITISFQFVETNFLEQDVYAGENSGIKLLKWDGTWKFDGTHSYS